MDLSKIRISPWAQVSLELVAQPGKKYQSRYLGYYPSKTVFVATPMVAADRPLLVRKEQDVIVRFFANKIACAFRASIAHICTTPFHYLHLNYPSDVETGTIRKAERVAANIRVSVINKASSEGRQTPGVIVDLSLSGARLETLHPVGAVGDAIVIQARVDIGRVSRLVTWDAEIKAGLNKFSMNNAVAAYGIEFNHLNDIDYLALLAYVNTQIARGVET